jgi:methyltransferase (TIGR00027 family)
VPSSRTAEYVALYRALETEERRRDPLFSDPYARRFLPLGLRAVVSVARLGPLRVVLERYADHHAPGARSSAICRTRFIDDVVCREAEAGARQFVILGAGFDCRAHRLRKLASPRVFEVDRRETQQRKRARLAGGARGVDYVQVDFQRDDLGERLDAAGWRRDARTTFVWEGVTNYLTESAVERVLAFVGGCAVERAIVFTYIHRGVLDGSARFYGADRLKRNVARLGEPWTFGIDPAGLAPFVERFGLSLEVDLGADEYRTRYAWAGDLRGYVFYRVAVARVGRSG